MKEPANAELESLLESLAPDELTRAALLEEHRQLEKDLLRLADPLPPPEFLSKVMARVAAQPARPLAPADVVSAMVIAGSAVILATVALVASGATAGRFGLALGSVVVKGHEGLVATETALHALWTTAALPLSLVLTVFLTVMLTVLGRWAQPRLIKAVQ